MAAHRQMAAQAAREVFHPHRDLRARHQAAEAEAVLQASEVKLVRDTPEAEAGVADLRQKHIRQVSLRLARL